VGTATTRQRVLALAALCFFAKETSGFVALFRTLPSVR